MSGEILSLAVFDDGTGPALYVGGSFSHAGNVLANGIARWDGNDWSPLDIRVNVTVYALTVFDDGSGPALYVGGTFTAAGGRFAHRVAKWDGTQWSNVTSAAGVDGPVRALTTYDDGDGPARAWPVALSIMYGNQVLVDEPSHRAQGVGQAA